MNLSGVNVAANPWHDLEIAADGDHPLSVTAVIELPFGSTVRKCRAFSMHIHCHLAKWHASDAASPSSSLVKLVDNWGQLVPEFMLQS
jgi:hypothetical protein